MKTVFASITICVILIIGLAANVVFYLQKIGTESDIASLYQQITALQAQIAAFQTQSEAAVTETNDLKNQTAMLQSHASDDRNLTSFLQAQNALLQTQKNTIQNELDLLRDEKTPPRLVTRIGARDMRFNYSGQDIRLYISGEVWNVGTETAHNCSLHVILYQGNTVAVDTRIWLGDLSGGSYLDVGRNIYYAGDTLTHWTITPEFN